MRGVGGLLLLESAQGEKKCLWGTVRKWEMVTLAHKVSSALVSFFIIGFSAETSRLSSAADAPCLH